MMSPRSAAISVERVLAGLSMAFAIAVLAGSVYRSTLPLSSPPAEMREPAATRTAGNAGLSEEALLLISERNPFAPGRGEASDSSGKDADVEIVADAPAITVLGTVVLADDRGLAMLQENGAPARLVRTGERFASFTLLRVEPGHAIVRAVDGISRSLPVRKK
jgi:hypothetical protein